MVAKARRHRQTSERCRFQGLARGRRRRLESPRLREPPLDCGVCGALRRSDPARRGASGPVAPVRRAGGGGRAAAGRARGRPRRSGRAGRGGGPPEPAPIRVEGESVPITAPHGLADEEAARQSAAVPPGHRDLRAVELTYRYAEGAREDALRAGLALPLADESGPVGTLLVLTRTAGQRFEDDELLRLEEIAHRTAPAIETARRFREARQLADLDALTELHNRRYFHETLARETVRAHRYARKLALIVFDLDDFKEVNDRIGHLAGDAVLAEAAARMREVVRTADVPCRVGGDEFAVIMPESSLEDAEQLFQRIQTVMSTRALGQAGRLHLSAGLAELTPEDDSVSLFERGDRALYAAKQAGKGRSMAATA